MRLILLILLLTGCSNKNIGEYYTKKDWVCLKTNTHMNTGMSMKGTLVLTSNTTCSVSKCFEITYVVKKWYHDKVEQRLLKDEECI